MSNSPEHAVHLCLGCVPELYVKSEQPSDLLLLRGVLVHEHLVQAFDVKGRLDVGWLFHNAKLIGLWYETGRRRMLASHAPSSASAKLIRLVIRSGLWIEVA